jgi:mycothiol synthase
MSKSIMMRPFQIEADIQIIVDLFDACERVDKLELSISVEQLRLELQEPGIDQHQDVMLWEDADQQLVGYGEIFIEEPSEDSLADGRLWFIVHPIARGGDLESKIIAWAEARLRAVGQERQGKPKLFTWSRSSRTDRNTILKDHGFAEDRHFLFSSKPLTEEMAAPQLPAGFMIRSIEGDQDIQAWVDLHNRAFCQQWNYHPLTFENRQHDLQNPLYLPDLDLVAVDAAGRLASICYCTVNPEHNDFLGRQEGWVALVCTDPDFQRRGLAKAMLLHGLQRLQALNIDIAKIGVDAKNAFGAKELYESIGFQHTYTQIAYVKNF